MASDMMTGAIDTTLTGMQARPDVKGMQAGHGQAMNPKRMRQVAEEFESVFLAEMLRPMFENTEAEAPFGGGPGEDIWRNMQIDEYGKAISRKGGIGIADAVMEHMIRLQEQK